MNESQNIEDGSAMKSLKGTACYCTHYKEYWADGEGRSLLGHKKSLAEIARLIYLDEMGDLCAARNV